MWRKRLAITSIMIISVVLLFNFVNKSLSSKIMPEKDFQEQSRAGQRINREKESINVSSTKDQLTKAVLENDIEQVNKIIESKSLDINEKDSSGKYPIEMVLVMGNCDMAKILLQAGADPYVTTSGGKSVYDTAMAEGSKYLKEIFYKYKK